MSDIPIPVPAESPSGQAPFGLFNIIVISTLLTPVAGGIMAAANWRRLGRPQNAIISIVIGVVGLIVALGVTTWLPLLGVSSRVSLAALIGIDVVSGLILATMQQAAFREWTATHNGVSPTLRRSGLLSFLATLVLSVIVAIVMTAVLQPTISRVLIGLQKPKIYTDGGALFTSPPGWVDASAQQSQEPLCSLPDQHCIALSYRAGGDPNANFIRFSGAAFKVLSAKDIDASVWNDTITKDYPSAKEISAQTLKVDGHDAFQRIYSYSDSGTDYTRLLEFVKEDSGAVVRLDITGSTAEFNADRSDIDAMAGSIHFIASKSS